MHAPSDPWAKLAPYLLSLLRIVTALLFMQHGAQKLFGLLGATPVHLISLAGLAGALEFFGGALVALGLFTRPAAFILSGEMAFAYFMAHFPAGPWPILNRGALAIRGCLVYFYISAAGAGPISIDRLIHGK
jgi:putative oxidoreductase